jgi:hypothetical protein
MRQVGIPGWEIRAARPDVTTKPACCADDTASGITATTAAAIASHQTTTSAVSPIGNLKSERPAPVIPPRECPGDRVICLGNRQADIV